MELIEVINWNTLTYGETVTLESRQDGTRIPAEYAGGSDFWLAGAKSCNYLYESEWRILVEKPKVELPTELGLYLDREGDIWDNLEDHWLKVSSEVYFVKSNADHMSTVRAYAPYTRLVPEGSERNQAIRDLRDFLREDGQDEFEVFIEEQFPEAFEE